MGLEPELEGIIETVVRALSTATRSLRLYPPTSPIPRQTIDSAISALQQYFASGASRLALAVARAGFALEGQPVAMNVAGSRELANALRDHGIAQIDILPEVRAEDLLGLLSVVSRPAEDVRAEGGIATAIASLGVASVQLTDVQLVVMDQSILGNLDVETRMREIADSPAKLGTWFASIASGDRDSMRENLNDLVEAAGESATENLAENLSGTLVEQAPDSRDALLSLALEPGHARDLTARMFGMMSAADIATTILGGTFGRNMLSLSGALASLPFDNVGPAVRQEVIAMLPIAGHGPTEAAFLGHMLEVRAAEEPELALVESDRTFRTIVSASTVSDADIARARGATTAATNVLDAVGVRTMLTLLDTQPDHDRFCAGVDSLVAMVPRLLAAGDLRLVAHLLDELAARETSHLEWSDLPSRLRQTLASAVSPASAEALVAAAVGDRANVPVVREILRFSGDATSTAIAQQAIAHKSDGLEVGEELLGRRLVDLLNGLAPQAQWFQLGPIVERLAAQGDSRSFATIGALLSRPEEQARREVISTLAASGVPPALLPLLGSALRDPSDEIAMLAARTIAKSGVQGAAVLLASRLTELDVDNTDFTLARELIGALARTPGSAADDALGRLATRRALIKRGRFAEIQTLVSQALALRQRGGVAS